MVRQRSLLAVLEEEQEATVVGAWRWGRERLEEEVGAPDQVVLWFILGAFSLLSKQGGSPGVFRAVMPSAFPPTFIDNFFLEQSRFIEESIVQYRAPTHPPLPKLPFLFASYIPGASLFITAQLILTHH